jgi:hypothetical protein
MFVFYDCDLWFQIGFTCKKMKYQPTTIIKIEIKQHEAQFKYKSKFSSVGARDSPNLIAN